MPWKHEIRQPDLFCDTDAGWVIKDETVDVDFATEDGTWKRPVSECSDQSPREVHDCGI